MDEITRRRIERLRRDLAAAEEMPAAANARAVAKLKADLARLVRRATQAEAAAERCPNGDPGVAGP